MSLTVAILCGGLGTRVSSLTHGRPKSLMHIDGRPFIDYQLGLLARQGIERVVLCIGYEGKQIADYVGSGQRFGLNVAYSSDGPEQLGTAGALRHALPWLRGSVGVLYGDTYPLYDLQRVYRAYSPPALMTVRSPGRGNVNFSQGRVRAYGSGWSYGDAGFSIFTAAIIEHVQGATDMGDLFNYLARHDSLAGYEVTEPVYEIGSPEGLAEFEEYVVRDRVAV